MMSDRDRSVSGDFLDKAIVSFVRISRWRNGRWRNWMMMVFMRTWIARLIVFM